MSNRVRLVVASSVMLTFISFWRAAAIVLNDMGSSAFYAGAIAEQAVGKAAPWFVLGVMLFASTVRMVYVESCSMFVRGGVYKVVKEALGGIGDLAHDAAQRVDLAHQVSFGDAADGGIAGHLRDQIHVQREQGGLQPHAGSSHGGLAPCVAGAHDNDSEIFRELHCLHFKQSC